MFLEAFMVTLCCVGGTISIVTLIVAGGPLKTKAARDGGCAPTQAICVCPPAKEGKHR